MKIVVCIKQTPIAAEAKFDETTKRLVRDGVRLSISSIDRRALLEALRLRSKVPGTTVTTLTMGPPQAKTALLETLSYGADDAVHLTDPAFAGSDTLATARALSAAIKKLKPDLIMCGRFTVDSETSQVPSEIAEMLDLPQVTSARVIHTTEDPNSLLVERETDEGHENFALNLPALISVTELVIMGRPPLTPEEQAAGALKPIVSWGPADIGLDPSLVGQAGSPTRVDELRSAKLERDGKVLTGDVEAAAKEVVAYMMKHGLFDPHQTAKHAAPRRPVPAAANPSKAVWVTAEMAQGQLRGVTLEMLGKAQVLASHTGGEVAAVLVGGPGVSKFASELAAYGADRIYVAEAPTLIDYETNAYTDVLASAIREHKPAIVLMASTTNGRDWAPRVAARLGLGLTGDCVDLEIDAKGEFAQIKPAFGGNIVAPIYSSTTPAMATVRPGMLDASQANHSIKPNVVHLDTSHSHAKARILEAVIEPGLHVTKLDNAQVVVGVGKGVGGPENVPLVGKLVDALDGAMAASLNVTTAKWVPPQLQLGLTGRALAPRFYIGVGVSGAANHMFGVRKAQHIIAVNNNPEAAIFKSADLGVVADWAEFVPALTRQVLEAKHRMRAETAAVGHEENRAAKSASAS